MGAEPKFISSWRSALRRYQTPLECVPCCTCLPDIYIDLVENSCTMCLFCRPIDLFLVVYLRVSCLFVHLVDPSFFSSIRRYADPLVFLVRSNFSFSIRRSTVRIYPSWLVFVSSNRWSFLLILCVSGRSSYLLSGLDLPIRSSSFVEILPVLSRSAVPRISVVYLKRFSLP